ncbi:MATE family efflux transporter [Vibrio sp.]|uniref:MATE family efflux transporter n=1 Tax=Vibrio sp. TaxID=678 RepID=UPI00311F604E
MSVNLDKDSISTSFYLYLWPALAGMLIKSLFIMGDGLIIGIVIGAEGLGALALIMPVFSVFTAFAMLIGIGGAAKMSIAIGKGKTRTTQTWFSQSILLILILSSITTTAAISCLDELLILLGASGMIAQLAGEYLFIMLPFFTLYSCVWVLSCFVRHDSNPKLATYAMSAGAVVNLLADYLFIIKMGMGIEGAAYGTIISQVLMLLTLLSHFMRGKGNLTLSFEGIGISKFRDILAMGVPSFCVEIATAITIILFNYTLLTQFDQSYVVAFGLNTNLGVFALFVMVAIGQACQPIMSFNYGANRQLRIEQTLRLGLKVAIISGSLFLIIIWLFASEIASLYLGDSSQLIPLATTALTYYFFAVPLMGFNIVIANLFQAIALPKRATVLALSRGFIFVIVGMCFLPEYLPINGIWLTTLFSESLAAIMALMMLSNYFRDSRLDRASSYGS